MVRFFLQPLSVRQMRLLCASLLAGFALCGALQGLCWGRTQLDAGAALCADTLRLHIRAASDAVADQSAKLRVRDAVLAEGARIAQEGVDEGLFRRLKKGVYGAKVRGLNSFENVCIELAQAHFAGVEYLTFPEVFDGISKADVEDCIRRWVTPERCGLAVVRPGEEA